MLEAEGGLDQKLEADFIDSALFVPFCRDIRSPLNVDAAFPSILASADGDINTDRRFLNPVIRRIPSRNEVLFLFSLSDMRDGVTDCVGGFSEMHDAED